MATHKKRVKKRVKSKAQLSKVKRMKKINNQMGP